MKFIMILFLLCASVVYANELVNEDIDVGRINELLPSNWQVSDIKNVESPTGWLKKSGDTGVQITLSRVPYSSKPAKTKSGDLEVYCPKFIFCIMPNNFSGESGNGVLFKDGKVYTPENMANRSMLILNSIKQLEDHYIFYIDTHFEDLEKPEELFDKILIKNKNPSPQSLKSYNKQFDLKSRGLYFVEVSPEEAKFCDQAIDKMRIIQSFSGYLPCNTIEEAAQLIFNNVSVVLCVGQKRCTEYKEWYLFPRLDWARPDDGTFNSGLVVKKGTNEVYNWKIEIRNITNQ